MDESKIMQKNIKDMAPIDTDADKSAEKTQNTSQIVTETANSQDLASNPKKRTGKTREHYNKQKSQAYSYFRIDSTDLEKMKSSQFTVYNFIGNSFSFSPTKKELTIKVLEELKNGEMTFSSLQKKLDAKKSTLYMLIVALQKSGLITEAEKNGSLKLSNSFADTLRQYSQWWEGWLKE